MSPLRPSRTRALLLLSVLLVLGAAACKNDDKPAASGAGSPTTAGSAPGATALNIGPPAPGFCDAVKAFRGEVNKVFTPPADQEIDQEAFKQLPAKYAELVGQAPEPIRDGMKLGQDAAIGLRLGVGDNPELTNQVKQADTYIRKECKVQLFGVLDNLGPVGSPLPTNVPPPAELPPPTNVPPPGTR